MFFLDINWVICTVGRMFQNLIETREPCKDKIQYKDTTKTLFRKYLIRAVLLLAAFLLLFLWIVTVFGRNTLTPPGWLAVLITILPYLYGGLLIFYLLLFCIVRKKLLLILMSSLLFSSFVLWGGALFPRKAKPHDQIDSMKVMVWNVQRMGEFSGTTQSIPQKVDCVSQLIKKEHPDVFALLEITHHQLSALQKQLGIPGSHCMWSDYYGTGGKGFGGLATCIFNQEGNLEITRKRKLNLPPSWKYLFIEVQHIQNDKKFPINFLALHIAPPEITDNDIEKILADLFKGKKDGVHRAMDLLKNYENQVRLQGTQAVNALQLIGKFQDPTIIAGDFNSTRDAALHVTFRNSLIDTWSTAGFGFGATRYWGNFLPLRIDYIYVTKDFAVQHSQTLSSACSDHLPVVSSVFLGNIN